MPFLFGIPGETYEDGLKTIEFALELDPDLANFHCVTPFPGTHLYEQRAKYGTVSAITCEDYTYQGAAFVPYTMTREQIHALRQLAFRRFYSRPVFLAAPAVPAAQRQRPARRGGRCQEPVLAVGASWPVPPGTRAGASPGSRRYSLASAG